MTFLQVFKTAEWGNTVDPSEILLIAPVDMENIKVLQGFPISM